MDKFTLALFPSQETLESATHRFLSLLGVQVNFSTLSSRLQEHPDYPSLLSIKDVVDSFGLETLALRPDLEQWPDVTIPFITQIAGQGRFARSFTVVRPAAEGSWEYLDPATRKWIPIDRAKFVQHFMPVALFAEAGEDAGEADYEETRNRDRAKAWGNWAKTLALPIS